MKTTKYLGVATLLAVGLATGAHAADTVTFAAAGSSAQFATFTSAFVAQGYGNNADNTTNPTGPGHYTLGSSANFQIVDTSVAGVPNENAQVAIYWQGSPGNYQIAVFYQVDSTVGVRAFFNNDTLTASATPPAGANLGATSGATDVVPPAEVLTAINGASVTVGATDITPEDARVATERSINLGYNNTNPIKTGVTNNNNPTLGALLTTLATPVRFSLTAKAFQLLPLGAVPIVVFINNGPTFSAIGGGGTNPPAYNLNIDSFTLAGFLSGQLNRTSDLILASGATANPVHTFIREPLSGTYNTMEYTNPESLAKLAYTNGKPSGSISASGGQELNVGSNPLNEPTNGSADFNAPVGSGRIRAIGTGQLIGAVNRDPVDALGYAFYSVGNFTGLKDAGGNALATSLRYLTVDGADPLQDNYSGGSITGAAVTFRNIRNGGYPLWSILRVVAPSNPSAAIKAIITSAQNANQGTDFVTSQSLRVFRSYHQTPYTVGAVGNGNNGSGANGGDVGGAVFSINNDLDTIADFGGSQLTNIRQ